MSYENVIGLKRLLLPGLVFLQGCGVVTQQSSTPPSGSMAGTCLPTQRVVYECDFGERMVSVCLSETGIQYRDSSNEGAATIISSDASWKNIHTGGNRSQGGLNQERIRFTDDDWHYVVHDDYVGELNEYAGRRSSGVVILHGSSAEDFSEVLDCPSASSFEEAFFDVPASAPDGWIERSLDDGGPYNAIY